MNVPVTLKRREMALGVIAPILAMLQIKVPGNPINVCTYREEITVMVYE